MIWIDFRNKKYLRAQDSTNFFEFLMAFILLTSQGNIWSTDMVQNSIDFNYTPFHEPSPLFNRLGVCYFASNGTYRFTQMDKKYALFKNRNDLNFTEVVSRLDVNLVPELCM